MLTDYGSIGQPPSVVDKSVTRISWVVTRCMQLPLAMPCCQYLGQVSTRLEDPPLVIPSMLPSHQPSLV